MRPPVDYLCYELKKAMNGLLTNEKALIEILCSKSTDEMKIIVSRYMELFDRPLIEQVCDETSGNFCRLLTMIITGVRDTAGNVKIERAKKQAAQLYKAGETKRGTGKKV